MTAEQLARQYQRLKEVTPIDGKLGDADRDLGPTSCSWPARVRGSSPVRRSRSTAAAR
jgi:hypothetical protein